MSRLLRALSVVAIMSIALVGGTALANPAHKSLTSVKLQLKWVAQSQFAGYFVAKSKGYYKKAGLNVTILNGGPQVTPETVVESGAAQFGIDWLPSLLHERDSGRKIVNVAQIYQATGMRMITFKTPASIPSPNSKDIPSACGRPATSINSSP